MIINCFLNKLLMLPLEKDADTALRLAGAVENDHGGRL